MLYLVLFDFKAKNPTKPEKYPTKNPEQTNQATMLSGLTSWCKKLHTTTESFSALLTLLHSFITSTILTDECTNSSLWS